MDVIEASGRLRVSRVRVAKAESALTRAMQEFTAAKVGHADALADFDAATEYMSAHPLPIEITQYEDGPNG